MMDDPNEFLDLSEYLDRIKEFCPELVQPSWTPVESETPTRSPNIATKFGGLTPWVSDTYKWPSCETCQDPMSFLCQINLNDLPMEFKIRANVWNGLFQCFYCFEDSCGPFADSFKVRIVPPDAIQVNSLRYLSAVASKDLDVTDLPLSVQEYVHEILNPSPRPRASLSVPLQFKERFVGNWKKNKRLEIPSQYEVCENSAAMAKLGMEHDDIMNIDYNDFEADEEEGEGSEDTPQIKIGSPSRGIKIGGWNDWQWVDYSNCPDCEGNPVMNTVFLQLEEDRSELVKFDYPDIADYIECCRAHVTLCSSCKNPHFEWLL